MNCLRSGSDSLCLLDEDEAEKEEEDDGKVINVDAIRQTEESPQTGDHAFYCCEDTQELSNSTKLS